MTLPACGGATSDNDKSSSDGGGAVGKGGAGGAAAGQGGKGGAAATAGQGGAATDCAEGNPCAPEGATCSSHPGCCGCTSTCRSGRWQKAICPPCPRPFCPDDRPTSFCDSASPTFGRLTNPWGYELVESGSRRRPRRHHRTDRQGRLLPRR